MKRILVTGGRGQVGWELKRTLATLGSVTAPDHGSLDLTDADALVGVVRETQPDVIVNAAAYTAVDAAEQESDLAMTVNGTAPGVLARAAARQGALFIHYSTDYVFDGTRRVPYREDDATGPLGAYGRSKLAGERAVLEAGGRHLIFRTSWVYGARGKNFLLTMRRLAGERDELRVVADQIGAPTWSRSLAEATAQIVALCLAGREAPWGVYHMTCGGETSWHGFTEAIVEQLIEPNKRPRVVPITTADYPLPAARPAYSVMTNDRLRDAFGIVLPHWRDALALCAEDLAVR